MASSLSMLSKNTSFYPLKETSSFNNLTVNVSSSLHHTSSASSIVIQSVAQSSITASVNVDSSFQASPLRRRSCCGKIDQVNLLSNPKAIRLSVDPAVMFADIAPSVETDDEESDCDDESARDSATVPSNCSTPTNNLINGVKSKTSSFSSSACSQDTCLICMNVFSKRNPPISIPCSAKCNSAPVHAKCVYEWKERQKDGNIQYDEDGDEIEFIGTCPLCRSPLNELKYSPKDIIKSHTFFMYHARRNFISQPIPKQAGIIRCFVAVTDTSLTDAPLKFEMYLQAPSTMKYPLGPLPGVFSPTQGDQLLLSARKRPLGVRKGIIDISLDSNKKSFSKKSIHYCGCVESNFLGTDHTVTSYLNDDGEESEIANIKYSQNRFGKAIGPRKMKVALPNVSPKLNDTKIDAKNEIKKRSDSFISEVDGDVEDFENAILDEYRTDSHRPSSKPEKLSKLLETKYKLEKSSEECKSAYLRCQDNKKVLFGANNEPYWLDSIQAYSLDFRGRVVLPSNKNFQLKIDHPEQKEIVLQFGKVTSAPYQVYTCDFQWPLSPLQAFGIVLSSMNRKLAVA